MRFPQTGPGSFGRRLLGRLRRLTWLRIADVLAAVDLRRPLPPLPPLPGGVSIREVGPEDEPALAAAEHLRSPASLRALFAGARGFAAFEDKETVGQAWVTDAPRKGEGEGPFRYDVRPPQGTAYVFHVAVAPRAQGRGIGAHLVRAVLADAREDGHRAAFLTYDRTNTRMARLVGGLGFRAVGELHYRRLLGVAHRDLTALTCLVSLLSF